MGENSCFLLMPPHGWCSNCPPAVPEALGTSGGPGAQQWSGAAGELSWFHNLRSLEKIWCKAAWDPWIILDHMKLHNITYGYIWNCTTLACFSQSFAALGGDFWDVSRCSCGMIVVIGVANAWNVLQVLKSKIPKCRALLSIACHPREDEVHPTLRNH